MKAKAKAQIPLTDSFLKYPNNKDVAAGAPRCDPRVRGGLYTGQFYALFFLQSH